MAVTPGGPGRQTARWPRPRPLSLEGYRSPPTPRATQDEYGVKTLSDCAALARKNPAAASMCVESESQSRDDGFPGVEKAYAFNLPNTFEYLLDTAVVHTELSWGGTCNFGEVYDRWPGRVAEIPGGPGRQEVLPDPQPGALRDRKSTRLNSSHANISYAVFCLKQNIKRLDRIHAYTSGDVFGDSRQFRLHS